MPQSKRRRNWIDCSVLHRFLKHRQPQSKEPDALYLGFFLCLKIKYLEIR